MDRPPLAPGGTNEDPPPSSLCQVATPRYQVPSNQLQECQIHICTASCNNIHNILHQFQREEVELCLLQDANLPIPGGSRSENALFTQIPDRQIHPTP